MDTLNKIRKLVGLDPVELSEEPKEIKLEQMALENGAVIEAEAFEAGQAVFVVDEEGAKFPLPEGAYTLEDGREMVVNAESIIESIGEASPEEEPEMEVEAEEAAPKSIIESIVKETKFSEDELKVIADQVFNLLEARLESYTLKVEEKEGDEKLAEDLQEKLSKTPTAEEVAEVETKKFSPEQEAPKRRVLSKNKPQSIKDRVLSKISN